MNRFFVFMRKFLMFLLIVSIISSAFYIVYRLWLLKDSAVSPPKEESTSSQEEEGTSDTEDEDGGVSVDLSGIHEKQFEVGSFGPDPQRLAYESGSMTLYVPRMDLRTPVLSLALDARTNALKDTGLTESAITNVLVQEMDIVLDEGVVLFNQAQLPGLENRNVSIAAHRDYKGMEFYDIDKLKAGDLIYLYYNGYEYIYEYDRTFITNDSDWEPVAVADKSVITLQSCDPIYAPNRQYDRIFAVATLIDVKVTTENSDTLDENTNKNGPDNQDELSGSNNTNGKEDILDSDSARDWAESLFPD